MFDWKGKKIAKIKDKALLTDVGISLVSAATCIRDKTIFRNSVYLSYNKKIDLRGFK